MSIKMDKQQVGRIIVGTGKVIVYGLSCLALLIPRAESNANAMKHSTVEASYSGAIKAIMDSDMLSSYKKAAVNVLLKNQDKEYYKAVIEVINSNMLDSCKVETIKKISE